MQIPKTLALDYGRKRIGVAISYGSLAEPLQVLEVAPGEAGGVGAPGSTASWETILPALHALIQAEQPEQLLVGVSEGKMAIETKHFVEFLTTNQSLPVLSVDETLSSQTASRKLYESNASILKKKQPQDHLAAAVFLQDWLDRQSGAQSQE